MNKKSEELDKIMRGLMGDNYNQKLLEIVEKEPAFTKKEINDSVDWMLRNCKGDFGVVQRAIKTLESRFE